LFANLSLPAKDLPGYFISGADLDSTSQSFGINTATAARAPDYARENISAAKMHPLTNDNLQNETGTTPQNNPEQPFWMTRWFQGVLAILLLFMILIAYQRRLRDIRSQSDHMAREIESRTSELKQQIEVRKKTEEELARRQKYLESMLFNSFNAIVVTDAPSNIIEWSAGAERLFGWTRDEVLGKSIDDVVTKPEFKKDALQLTSFIMHGQKVSPCEAVRYRKGGTPINVILAGSPVIINDEYVGYMAVYTDITELKKAEEAAKEASRIKSEFLANMSHEIRTPMNGIFGMTELVLETQLTNEQRDYLETVKTSAESLMTIINDILDFSKIEAKKIELESIPFHLRDTVHSIVASLALMAEKKGLELAYDIASDVPNRVTGDPGRLRQILTNLIGNAIKFTTKGEVIVTLRAEVIDRSKAKLNFQVRDTGIGISPEKINLIFAPFSQADGSTTRVFGGTGLGLTICQQLVELMGGRMGVESEAGKGSTFHFSVNIGLREEEKDGLPIPVSFKDLQDLSALIVDDNAANCEILHKILSAWGLRPTMVDGGEAALDVLRRAQSEGRSYRLIITAANMPNMDGFALAEKIQDNPEYGSAIIMMLCSTGIRGDSGRCRKLGLKAYLTKPVKQSTLLDAIRLALGIAPERQSEAPLITKHSLIQERPRFNLLLAEDNPINQKLAVKILENHGHRVTVVPNGEEAVAASKTKFFDLILMDVQMPRLDGFQATRRIREQEKESGGHIPIVAITANAMPGDREQCLAAGMDEYSAKPLNPVALLQTIELVMEKTKETSLLI